MRHALLPLAIVLLTGCAGSASEGPSLLPRAAEKQTFDEPAPAPVATATPDATLDLKIGELVADRIKAVKAFAEADARAAPLLRAGARAPVGSDAWLDAQTAVGALDAERATILRVQTDLEELASARVASGVPPYPALTTELAETEAELDRISAIVANRKAALPL